MAGTVYQALGFVGRTGPAALVLLLTVILIAVVRVFLYHPLSLPFWRSFSFHHPLRYILSSSGRTFLPQSPLRGPPVFS
ncbi:MAG: hypothetical protein JW760_12290 [Spirochaetales bacterium]|nr:hypothetical protein [Spirochaetales bacterium]